MYEKSDTFRQFGWLERWGINPTVTFRPDDSTKIRLSYEYFHDARTADRGNPSLATSVTRINPFQPGGTIRPKRRPDRVLRQPEFESAKADVHTLMGFIDHDFGNGLTVKNGTYFADYKKFYQNVYPGNGPLAGAVDPVTFTFNRAAYNHQTNRDNTFNDTDFIYKAFTGPLFHTIGFGTQFGRQTGIDVRNTGLFPNGTSTHRRQRLCRDLFGPINFVHQFPGVLAAGSPRRIPTATTRSTLNQSTRATRSSSRGSCRSSPPVVLTGSIETALDMNTNIARNRVDNFVSPQAAVILKPAENLSIYYAYRVSYLPASGDQFSALTDGSVILAPQKFVNNEVGIKWNALPHLLFSAAGYELNRYNVPLPDPNRPGFFILSGANRIRGFETELRAI